MERIVAAYQPHYYPRLHYLARAQEADVFVIYDDVQFSRSSPHHRAPIEHQDQSWLTVPTRDTGVDTTIDDVRIDMTRPWPTRHLKSLVGKYGEGATELRPFYERLCPSVIDPNALRENPDRFDGDEVEEWVEIDEEWRARNRTLERLQSEKNRIGEEISTRKREEPDAAVEDLVEAAKDVGTRLEYVEKACHRAKEHRDRRLVEISSDLEIDGADELTLRQRWELDGIDPTEWIGDVNLVDLTVPLLEELFRRFEVTSDVVRSSELPLKRTEGASEYLARLTEYFEGDSYLSGGVGYDNYMDETPFEERGLDVIVQDWTPEWEGGNVCALDVLYGADDPAAHVR